VTSTRRQNPARRARSGAGGFTLIEVMVAMLVVSLIVTIGVKGFRSITKSHLRESAAHMSGAIRYLFDRASITGKYYRLVIDLNDGKYWPEVSDDKFYAPNQAESEADRQKREAKEDAAD
jgi:prepilin-type N-terminal cleavage/methylation domain-containing protein